MRIELQAKVWHNHWHPPEIDNHQYDIIVTSLTNSTLRFALESGKIAPHTMVNYSLNKAGPLALLGYEEDDTCVMLIFALSSTFAEYGPYLEMCASIFCMCCNFYSAMRFMHVGTYSTNFRIVMISMNLIVTGTALFRPIYVLVPEEVYSIEAGNCIAAVVMYTAAYFQHICTYTFDAKYLIIGLERRMAYKLRATYEHSQDKTTLKVFAGMVVTVWMIVTVKAICVVLLSHENVDRVFHRAFIMDGSFFTLVGAHVIALVGWVYGYYTFHYLNKQAKRIKYCGSSLSESFTIKEITNVIKAVRPVIIAYRTVVIVGFCVLTIITISFYLGAMDENDIYYQALVTFEYVMIDVYNVYSSGYMIWNLKPLRKAFLDDISCLFPKKVLITEVEPETIEKYDNEEETKIYFEQLTSSWK
ncbi:unnamed protein product [Bursaphelenchus xylophilus]|uniref:(pine wood nematode) hypothetical protein n=1 Tax=Bursaphelenchus xylophilus TaxID=6326 RepID=A0A1I7RJK3_BURXY|nr:unnamed protein product [Bursaphelenchus xylophilus]CAG9128927.1 unnamed protein product [Bursaphelenchus xylophilus]